MRKLSLNGGAVSLGDVETQVPDNGSFGESVHLAVSVCGGLFDRLRNNSRILMER